ncbi:MAG: HDIG domain-containing protein [Ardenticatenaceae bacterium]|nr:HDIG domain-containing protein [Ardenticatenaceae bacterium]
MSTDNSTSWQRFMHNSQLWIFVVTLTLGLTAILSFNLISPQITVTEGQPAPEDIYAPRSLTYTSSVLTEQAKEQARSNVPPVYTPFDPFIGRTQVAKAGAVFSFIEVVRADSLATTETKLDYLQKIDDLIVEGEVGRDLLRLNQTDFQGARQEVLKTIDELMSQEIRADQLANFQRAARRPNLVLTTAQDNVVTNLAHQFIVENVFLDEATTAQRQEEAANAIEPVVRTVPKDRRIVQVGDTLTTADIELLTQFGLLQQETNWANVGSLFLISLMSTALIAFYWQRFHNKLHENGRYYAALAGLLLLFTLAANLMIPSPGFLPFLFPISALSMLMAVIFDIRFSVLSTLVIAYIAGLIAPNSLELSLYTAVGGLMAVLTLRDLHRLNAFFRAGLMAALGHILVILIFRLPQDTDIIELIQLILYGLANGVFSTALTLIGFYVIGSIFRVTTTFQLQELSRLDHPLLRELLRRAPGTYHHSIMVANLAEQAAENIKANSTLVRVGAFYHDIGKMNRPPFFTENQQGINPHDSLDPYTSVRIILGHVSDGMEMAKRYRLPDRIRDFIAEHHGTRIAKGFYLKAVEKAEEEGEEVDKRKFSYALVGGRRPRSRETGIVMMADAIEATSTALRPDSEKAIEKLVNSIIDSDLTDGQLDESGLTLGDIKLIRASFIETLKGRYHVRVKYPGNEELEVDDGQAAAVQTDGAISGLPTITPSGSTGLRRDAAT